ncbi:MAG: choice-of-anchor D domain-containing protein, partial [Pirellulales bacterium]|nr:choice-of-anchor D domain-containing protein [Pirellulales bacterium]
TGTGGVGGDATSGAAGLNVGDSSVTVNAYATGGNGGIGRGIGEFAGAGGSANSTASGTGGAYVTVSAVAQGGTSGVVYDGASSALVGGNAIANATGTGARGSVSADATAGRSNEYLVTYLDVSAYAPIASTSNTSAQALLSGPGFDISAAANQQAAAFAYGAPSDTVSLPLVLGNAVHANFDISGSFGAYTIADSGQFSSDVFGIGVLGGSYSENGSGALQTYSSNADFDINVSLLQTGDQNLLVGFMNPVINDDDFDDPDFSVRFRIQREGITVEDHTFTDAVAARAYFEGATLDLGSTTAGVSGDLDIRFLLDVTTDTPNSGIAVDYIFGNSTITKRAVPYLPKTTINIGNIRQNDSSLQGVEVRNVAVSSSDKLNAVFSGTSGNVITNGGSITGLAAGSIDNSSMQVGIDTSIPGMRSGFATFQFTTDGTVSGTAEVFGTADVTVHATVWRLAEAGPHSPEPVDLGNIREGDTFGTQTLSIQNVAPDDGYSESLNGSIGSATGDASSNGGSFYLLEPQMTDRTSLIVGLGNASTGIGSAGVKSGTATIRLESDGTGTSGLIPNVSLPDQTVNVTGKVFRLADPAPHAPEPVDLGIVHVGELAQQSITMSNQAAVDGFSESLNASFTGTTGSATASGTILLLGPGASDNTSLLVGIDTSMAGPKVGTATIDFESDGTGTSGLGVLALPGKRQIAIVTAQVNHYAEPVFDQLSGNGTFKVQSATEYTLDFGTTSPSYTALITELELTNGSLAPADDLAGNFTIAAPGFTLTHFDPFTGLRAGDTIEDLFVELDTASYGIFTGTITLSSTSENTSSTSTLPDITIFIEGRVTYEADFNEDFSVDSDDFMIWDNGFGKVEGAHRCNGDADADNDVDGYDFLIWQRQYGNSLTAMPVQGAVPEPSSWILMVLAGLILVVSIRNKVRPIAGDEPGVVCPERRAYNM